MTCVGLSFALLGVERSYGSNDDLFRSLVTDR